MKQLKVKKIWLLIPAFFCIGVAVVAGLVYSKKGVKTIYQDQAKRKSYRLLDDQGKLFDTSAHMPLLLVFLPTKLNDEVQSHFLQISKILEREARMKIAYVSQHNREILQNFKRLSGSKLPFLSDQSKSVAAGLGVWLRGQKDNAWRFVHFSENGPIIVRKKENKFDVELLLAELLKK